MPDKATSHRAADLDGLCANLCGASLPVNVDLEWTCLHAGRVYAFCSRECQDEWLMSSYAGRDLSKLMKTAYPEEFGG